jgi:hypothetical protein
LSFGPIRTRASVTGEKAVIAVLGLLVDAGCAVNELTRNDYGFDLHVLLPKRYPDRTSESWQLSGQQALVQVKGSERNLRRVPLRRQQVRFFASASVPTYVALSTPKGEWIELIERLEPVRAVLGADPTEADEDRKAKLMIDAPGDRALWDPETFANDASLMASLGTARRRMELLDLGTADRGSSLAERRMQFLHFVGQVALAEQRTLTATDIANDARELLSDAGIELSVAENELDDLVHRLGDDHMQWNDGELGEEAVRLGGLLQDLRNEGLRNRDVILFGHRGHFVSSERRAHQMG